MVTTWVKPRGPIYACKHARTHARVFVELAGIPTQAGGCYLAFDSVTYQASCYLLDKPFAKSQSCASHATNRKSRFVESCFE
jgi:hypothetical protein